MHRAITVFLILCLFPIATTAQAPLKTLAEVRAVPHQEAAKRLPVEVEGTVIFFKYTGKRSLSKGGGLILHDGNAGCYIVSADPFFRERDRIRPGTRVRAKGFTNGQHYFPDILDADLEVLSQGPLPTPRRVSASDLFSPEIDSDWVEVDAVVMGVEPRGEAFTVVVEIEGRTFKAAVPHVGDAAQRAAALMQRRVRLQAIVGTVGRQLTDRYFLVPSFDHFVPIDQTHQRVTVPLRKIATLLLSDNRQEDLVRISGVVTQQNAGGLYIRDDTGSTFAQSVRGSHPPGSVVTVEGYAAVAPFRPIMRAVRVEKLGMIESPPPPLQLETVDIDVGLHNERVAIDCEFVDQADGEEETVLRCRTGDHPFEARVPTWDFPIRPLKKGDQLRLTGIYEVTTSRPNPRSRWADGFRLHLSGPDAIMVVRPAPWWTLQRAFVALGLVVTVLIGIFLWNGLLRRKVAAQAETIAAQVEQAAIKDERQRVARELHDTLEQELTGLSIQLGNIAAVLGRDNTPAHQGLSLARQMLQHSRDEARASISELRDSHLLERSLPEAMRRSFAAATEDATAEFRFEVEGDPQPLRATTANHLLRIACEAVRNAVRHANAKRIATRLTYGRAGVDLEIDDDGVGFQADQKPPAGHFGLAGMRERANKIHAEYSVQSSEGLGSKVRVQLPWSSPVAHPESPS